MRQSELRLIKRSAEFVDKDDADQLPRGKRGIYVLYHREPGRRKRFTVLYVGMARAGAGRGLKRRILAHRKSPRKKDRWTHFSVFEVWDNISDEEVVELEGLFRHIYRFDASASRLNVIRGFKKLEKVESSDLNGWDR